MTGSECAIRLWKEGEAKARRQTIPLTGDSKIGSVKHLASGTTVPFTVTPEGVTLSLPEKFPFDAYADDFVLQP